MRALLPLLAGLILPASAAAAQCPADTAPAFDPKVPTWQAVNGYPIGTRQATNAEVVTYMRAVDAASDAVHVDIAGLSHGGRELPVAWVSSPEHVEQRAAIARRMRRIRAARARPRPGDPAIVWLSAGVHGNEPSATDAHMHILYELAARTDCLGKQRRENLMTVIFPLQNPDGRVKGQRVNGYRFDLNRDWFARTQPETRVKLYLLEQYPPLVYVDGHEQEGTAGFFPPNADPIHHEIAAEPLHLINDVLSPAMRAAMDAKGRDYTNYTTYDLFYMGYGDTVPSTLFGAAGMTFEKGGEAPYPEKEDDHHTLADTVLTVTSARKDELLRAWARVWRTARREGRRGQLEPNLVVQPMNQVRFPVPTTPVHAYVLRNRRHGADAAALVQRLRSMGVVVRRLRRPVRARGFVAYGSVTPGRARLPRGTYVVPMAQANKHWVQALLGQDSYVPFPYFYDVSGWSNPLLMGVDGGWMTRRLPARSLGALRTPPAPAPRAGYAFRADDLGGLALVLALGKAGVKVGRTASGTAVVTGGFDRLRALAAGEHVRLRALKSVPATVPVAAPTIAVLTDPLGTVSNVTVDGSLPLGGPGFAAALASSEGWLRWVLERRLGVPTTGVGEVELSSGGLAGYTALIVPDGTLGQALSPLALRGIADFVNGGGTYIGMRAQGLAVAQAAGLTTAQTQDPPDDFQVPGASLRTVVDDTSPVALGMGKAGWAFNTGDPIIAPGSSHGKVVVRYAEGDAFRTSGYTEGVNAVRGTPVVLDESAGRGHAVIFAVDAAFRGYVEATEAMVVDALLRGPAPAPATAARPVGTAPLAALAGPIPGRSAVIRVGPEGVATLRAAASGLARYLHPELRGGLTLRVPNARTLQGHPPRAIERVLEALARAGVRPQYVAV
jgi:hypothetical protein